MPEFIQNELRAWKTIKVHFESREDMEAFAEFLDQRITLDTQSIWYPELEIGRFSTMKWVDAPEPEPLPEGTEAVDEG